MMKNIVKFIIPCLAIGLGLTGCYDEMDSKASIDEQYASNVSPSLSVTATPVDFSSVKVNATLSDIEDILEVSVMYSAQADFSDAKSIISEEPVTNFETTVGSLSELTTYYVRACAFTADGRNVFSETAQVATLAAPVFDIDGNYTAVEFGWDDDSESWKPGEPYTVSLSFVEGSDTEVEIKNVFRGELTITGTYDSEAATITIPNKQVIYNHPSYGAVWMEGSDGDIVWNFTAKGGYLNDANYWGAVCTAGSFGSFYLEMAHQ